MGVETKDTLAVKECIINKLRSANDGGQLFETAGFSEVIAMTDSVDFGVGSSDGTKLATASTQKLGFWGATPVVQAASADQAAPAAYATGAFGLNSDANMEALYDLVVAMRTALVNAGIMKGSA
jgi:hypothetical protein|tara:strand:+ start:3425 stop:3796 length:372 start_codon:yes stop_codon:yes gene_type:complete